MDFRPSTRLSHHLTFYYHTPSLCTLYLQFASTNVLQRHEDLYISNNILFQVHLFFNRFSTFEAQLPSQSDICDSSTKQSLLHTMRLITLSVVLGVVLGLVGRTDSFSLPGLKVQTFRNFALRVSTDPSVATGSACKLPVIEDPTSQSERATKGRHTADQYLQSLQTLKDVLISPYTRC